MPRKPVIPGRKPKTGNRDSTFSLPDRAVEKAKLVTKGVSMHMASWLVGEGETLTRKELAERRIEWQRTLHRSS